MSDSQAKFQQLLRELFQFDSADLDFGIYRIMNHKRDVIERFIAVELPQAVADELDHGAAAEQAQLQGELADTMHQIKETLGETALDADGNLAVTYLGAPIGKKYQELRERAAGAMAYNTQEAAVYNHLFTFFGRYYQEGDFISKRRYSKQERYAIPYNGEEVMLYWANHDQYYVKSGEYFTDYSYKAPNGVTVHFKLRAADVEQNNVKGDKRFFLPQAGEIAWDAASDELVIPCVFRPLTQAESTRYGKSNQQDAIIDQAVAAIVKQPGLDQRALAALTAERRTDARGNPVSYVEHHLRQYTRRNTSDFFIHKDLAGFLGRELDFYLKNEVLNLAELEAAGEELAAGWFQLLRLIKRVGGRIIDFLAQIEAFQKMLWEKRKFVTESFYCVRVGVIAQEFYAEIAANDAQWQAWHKLYDLDDPKTVEKRVKRITTHPGLMLDTRLFAPAFVDRLLASFADLDGWTDGLLVHSENWQALNLLGEKYRGQVKCVYIDPPYNTGGDGFIYKDNYQHASWLAMMKDRLQLVQGWMTEMGAIFVSIDDNEQPYLRSLLGNVFGAENFVSTVIWQKIFSPKNSARHFSEDHDFILVFAKKSDVWRPNLLPRTDEVDARYTNPDDDPRGLWSSSDLTARNYYSEGQYEVVSPSGKKFRSAMGTYWRVSYEKFLELDKDKRIWWGADGKNMPRLKRFLSDVKQGLVPQTLWFYQDVGHTQDAKKELLASVRFERAEDVLNTVKPTALIQRIVRLTTSPETSETLVDFFAGSGSTGHAVINLNREDGGWRRFILVEMGDYFDTVLLPRNLKVSYTPEWREGKPKRMATAEEVERSPRLIKVLRLESYEDALNNIEFDDGAGQQAMQFEDYLLQYMLQWETRQSATLLNVATLANPFAYTLHIHRDGATRSQPVDLPETFAYLLGLTVHTRRVYDDGGRRYVVYRGALRNGRTVAVLWRTTAEWTEADYARDRDFVAAQKLAEGADDLFVNGDSFIPGAQALEGVFKARMFAPVEA